MSGPLLGIVVPTLDEERRLPLLLEDLAALRVPHRTVVVDGGSSDGTAERARAAGVELVTAPRGRAPQLNAGARALDTPWLLFLHADVRMPESARRALDRWLEEAAPDEVGIFGFRLAGDAPFWRLVERVQRTRQRWTGLAYGDQGLLVHRDAFASVGGYPELPIMEDVEILRRLRRQHRVRPVGGTLVSSPRRYEREGRLRTWLRNGLLISLHLAGVPSRHLAPLYGPERTEEIGPDGRSAAPEETRSAGSAAAGRVPEPPSAVAADDAPGSSSSTTLLVFARDPVPGRVKTRLAREVGAERAARIYAEVAGRVVDGLRGGPWRTVICYDPPGSGPAVRRWLDPVGLAFRPQSPGDLGLRMEEAFAEAFRDAGRVCVVGTDAPAVDRAVVSKAFRLLGEADLVVGPSTDGGYYLLALSRPHPSLFRDVPWSTPDVLSVTLRKAREEGLRIRLLDEATDLDTADDLDALGLGSSRGFGRSLPG